MEIKTFQQSELSRDIGIVIGTRPGIVMFAPIIKELRKNNISHFVIHSGQHYSPNMDSQFFRDLKLPQPDYRLDGVDDKKTHGAQTAKMLEGIETILMNRRPCLLLVGGDANTNLSGALAARKLHILVGHIEAGERSYDWCMPEEHNRVIIDHISDHLFVTGDQAIQNLKKEGIKGKIHLTGNPIVDASMQHFELAKSNSDIRAKFDILGKSYGILTMHREENVDVKQNLINGLLGVTSAADYLRIKIIFLAHPRTLKRLREYKLRDWVSGLPNLRIYPAVGYLKFLNLIAHASIVFTDSGGVQQEACIHKVPCVTLRNNTEWVETIEIGANRLAGCNPDRIVEEAKNSMKSRPNWSIPFGLGDAAQEIVSCCIQIIKTYAA